MPLPSPLPPRSHISKGLGKPPHREEGRPECLVSDWRLFKSQSATYLLCNLVAVQSLSRVRLFLAPGTAACLGYLSFTISWSLFKPMSIESVMLSNHLILCHAVLGHIVKLVWPQFPHLKCGNHHSIHLEGLMLNEMTYVSLSGCPRSRLRDKHLWIRDLFRKKPIRDGSRMGKEKKPRKGTKSGWVLQRLLPDPTGNSGV